MELLKRVLALGAHFDDIESGVGGTLSKHIAAGDDVFIAITSSDEYRTGRIDNRMIEQSKSLGFLGISMKNLFCFYSDQNDFDIIGILDKLRPDILYTTFELDTHQAHVRCSHIGRSVGRKPPVQVIFYSSCSSYDFQPNFFSIIDFDFKEKLLYCFESQIYLNAINIDLIRRRESFWASLITTESCYAEGFVIRKMIYEIC